MRIALVCPYDLERPGGVQQQCLELAARLREGGDEATVVGPGRRPGTVGVGAPLVVPANRSRVPLTLDPRVVRRVRAAVAGADVVHLHEPLVPLVGWAGLRVGGPRVNTFHADPARWTRVLYRAAGRALHGAFATHPLTAVSPVAAAALPAAWGVPRIVPNGIDVAGYPTGRDRIAHRVAFVGRDDPRKGLPVLLRAWPSIRERVPHAELVVVGSRGPARPGVVFRGRLEEAAKREVLATAAVAVAPNLGAESFGIVVAEAMAAGCAVVASDLPAFRGVLDGAGILVPPGDPAALAEAVVGRLQDAAGSAALGERARRSAARYDWSVVAGQYRRVYESAVTGDVGTMGPWKE
jgi:phosphatidylinositol alpha-mannosyltransferase